MAPIKWGKPFKARHSYTRGKQSQIRNIRIKKPRKKKRKTAMTRMMKKVKKRVKMNTMTR